MRYFSIFFSLSICLLLPPLASANGYRSLRPLDADAAEAIETAVERSQTTRALVARLDSSNVIVHIELSRQLPAGISGLTRFVASRGGYRYLRITISNEIYGWARTAILAHELQHACEVADSDADDTAGLRKVFERHGHRSGEFFETAAAIATQKSVSRELRLSRTLQAEPVAKFDH